MGVTIGANDYTSKEAQMYDISQIVEDMMRQNKYRNYTKEQFKVDFANISYKLGLPMYQAIENKNTMFHLINIKLQHGDAALEREIRSMKRR